MTWLVWTGTALALAGLAVVIWCILAAFRARRSLQDDAALRARLQRIVVVNMVGLLVSALGLMSVVMGVILA